MNLKIESVCLILSRVFILIGFVPHFPASRPEYRSAKQSPLKLITNVDDTTFTIRTLRAKTDYHFNNC